MRTKPLLRRVLVTVGALAALVGTNACGADRQSEAAEGRVTVRLGYFPNVTHAPAIVGLEKGYFAQALRPNRLRTFTFNAGPAAVEALLSGAIDIAYVGPNPAVNAFSRSGGRAVRVIAGSTAGGAALVVRPGIATAADLRGRRLATPQLGNTQDVALRYWLREQGLRTDPQGGGDVTIVPQENAQTLETFRRGEIDGAWVPEPWASRLVLEGGGRVLIDERSLWPGGRFTTTVVVARTAFLRQHPEVTARLLVGHLRALRFIGQSPAAAQDAVNAGLAAVTGKRLPGAVLVEAWKRVAFTDDPLVATLRTMAEHATVLGLLPAVDLSGIFDGKPLARARALSGGGQGA